MTVNQMSYFVTLCRCANYTKAAAQLYISQPALSKQISALEKELGLKLVERKSGGRISITPSGEAYCETFTKILNSLEESAIHARSVSNLKKYVFKIGIMEGWMMQDYVRSCMDHIASVSSEIDLQFGYYPPHVINMLKDEGALDYILIIDAAYNNSKSYSKEMVASIHPILFTSARSAACSGGSIDLNEKGQTVYLINEKEAVHINMPQIDSLFGASTPIYKEAPNVISMIMNVLSGDGCAVSDEWSFPRYSREFVSVKLEDANVPVIFAKKESAAEYLSETGEFLKKELQEWIKKAPGLFNYEEDPAEE